MAKTNVPVKTTHVTHEGAPAKRIGAMDELRRTVMACLLWEDSFYESGEESAKRIQSLVHEVDPQHVAGMAVEARTKMKLRHVPLLLARELARHPDKEGRKLVSGLLEAIIQRPDELTEFLAIYWKDKKQPLSAQVKKGLAAAFLKFDEFSLAKYNRDGAVKLRDVMFLTHPNPNKKKGTYETRFTDEHEQLFKKLAEKTLTTPDTWEVALSAGKDKRETFERLLTENKLGALALLRNLRNMQQSGVPDSLVKSSLESMKVERVLPFRFISAAKYAPTLEPELEKAMYRCLEGAAKLKGKTTLLVDGSGSMFGRPISAKSEIDRFEAACALAILLREICDECEVICFSTTAQVVAPRRGFALRDILAKVAERNSTNTERAKLQADANGYDRLIVLTDEQSHTALSNPKGKGYVVNIAGYRNGVGYGKWMHIDGWSEAIVDYIQSYEEMAG